MAYALRATYTQENNYGITDLLEIYEDGFSGTVIELGGRHPCAFDFEHRESTSTQRDFLSIFENQILMGVLDLYAWIDTEAKKTLVNDIADSPTTQFQIRWKRDDTLVWYGYPHGRIIEYPEKPQYNVKIQFRDFEILKGLDYPILDALQKRQKIIDTFSDIFIVLNQLALTPNIETLTSWQCEGTTLDTDFLYQVYHDTYVLRTLANDENGYSNDQNISYYGALLRIADPMLVIHQWEGFRIHQLSAHKDPTSVLYTVYSSSGTRISESITDRSYTLSDSQSTTPSVKTITNNTTYPALKRAIYEFQHRSGSSQFQFETRADLTDEEWVDNGNFRGYISSIPFEGNGDEVINFKGQYYTAGTGDAPFVIHIGTLALDFASNAYSFVDIASHSGAGGTLTVSSVAFNELTLSSDNLSVGDPVMLDSTGTLPDPLTNDKVYYVLENNSGVITLSEDLLTRSVSSPGTEIDIIDEGTGTISYRNVAIYKDTVQTFDNSYRAKVSFTTEAIPDIASDDLEVILLGGGLAEGIGWYNMSVIIQNPTQLGESIEFRLIQDNDYSESLRLPDSYFGDGPYPYSRSSYRTSTTLGDITTGWRRRGDTTYLDYSRLKLNEVLDYQRVRQLKKTFKLNGEAQPDKIAVYETDPYMYVGGRYNGRWTVIGVKVEENTDA